MPADKRTIEKAVKEQLGKAWKVVQPTSRKADTARSVASKARTHKGPSVAELRSKFLGSDKTNISDGKSAKAFASTSRTKKVTATTVLVAKDDGVVKAADYRGGKIKIVQG